MNKSTKILMILAGVATVAIGVFCLLNPVETILSMAWMVGFMLIIGGAMQMGAWSKIRRLLPQSGLMFLSAMLKILLGALFLVNPAPLALGLPFIFALWVLTEGVQIAVGSSDFKQAGFKYWYVILIVGIIASLFGCYGLYNIEASAKVLSTLVGVGIIFSGIGYFVRVWATKKAEDRLGKMKDKMDSINAEYVEAEVV